MLIPLNTSTKKFSLGFSESIILTVIDDKNARDDIAKIFVVLLLFKTLNAMDSNSGANIKM
jgi:hypothetical protein